MAAAYATFPSMGWYVPPRTYSKVVDADGNILLDRTMDGEYVIKESTAYYINNMLQGVISYGTATDAAFSGMTMAGKTGTTTSKKDLWFVGYTPYYTAAVWAGYDRQEELSVNHPQVALWKKVMSKVHQGLPNKSFPNPSDRSVVYAEYCLDSGMIPTEACALDARGSRVATGTYLNGDQPVSTCTLHTTVDVCTADPVLDEETGEPTKAYHLAGEHCPEETVTTIALLDFVREGAAAMAKPADNWVLQSNYEAVGPCRIHDGTYVPPSTFDPENPETWPVNDPTFDPNDPTTWPNQPAGDPSSTGQGAGAPDDQGREPSVPAGSSPSLGNLGIPIT